MNKFFTVRASADGLWLEIKGNTYTAVINLTSDSTKLEHRAALEVWQQMRETTCYRCGESREETSGCRDPFCPGSLEDIDR